MSWNPSSEVAVARDAAARLSALAGSGVTEIAVLYKTADGRLGYASYGPSSALCREARRVGEMAYDAVMADARGWR